MAERKRAIQLKFYVTEQERALIEEKMKLLQTDNLRAYLRKMAIDGYIIQLDFSAVKDQKAEIQKVGVNVNQIARRVNSTGNAYKEDFLVIFREQLLAALVGSGRNSGFIVAPLNDGDFTVRAWQECALFSPGFRARKKQDNFFSFLLGYAAGGRWAFSFWKQN